ncbi:MAG TPA: Uma2 family endonuclease [Polyangiaceae bacterium]
MQQRTTVSVRYAVRPSPEAWVLPEGTVPEAPVHHDVAHRLTLLLEAWAPRQNRPLRVLRNLAIRWLEEYPQTGIDPDVCVLDPPPANLDDLGSLCFWKTGYLPPPICFEIVSVNHPYKDYGALQDRYAAMGTHELVIFDPLLAGPPSLGGPVALQLWRRDVAGGFERVHFGNGPTYSESLDCWLIPDGRTLQLARDRAGRDRFKTEAEYRSADAERAQADAERAQASAERERHRRELLEQQVRELESKLGR